MGGGGETTEGVGWRKADSERPGQRARRREEIGRGRKAGRREDRGTERPRDPERDCERQEREPAISSLPRGGESQKSSSPRGGQDRDPQPPRSRRLWPPPPEAGGPEPGAPHWPGRHRPPSGRRRAALGSLSPPLSWGRAPGVFERRRTRGPPASAPHSRSRSAIRASTGRAPRLGAHVRRFLLHVPRTLCCRAAEPQSSKVSSCGSCGSCGPSGSALGRRRRCSAGRGRDPRGETSATPKVTRWRRAPASASSTRPLPRVAAAEEGRREG